MHYRQILHVHGRAWPTKEFEVISQESPHCIYDVVEIMDGFEVHLGLNGTITSPHRNFIFREDVSSYLTYLLHSGNNPLSKRLPYVLRRNSDGLTLQIVPGPFLTRYTTPPPQIFLTGLVSRDATPRSFVDYEEQRYVAERLGIPVLPKLIDTEVRSLPIPLSDPHSINEGLKTLVGRSSTFGGPLLGAAVLYCGEHWPEARDYAVYFQPTDKPSPSSNCNCPLTFY